MEDEVLTTVGVPLNMTSSLEQDLLDMCDSALEKNVYHILYVVIIGILITLDVFLLVAIFTRWHVLRRNIVHCYIISCLFSVLLFSIVSLIELFHSLYHVAGRSVPGGLNQPYNSSDPEHRAVYREDAYLKGLSPIMMLIIELNIAALVYAISDGTIFVGRYSEPISSSGTQDGIKKNRLVKFKTTKAIVVLSIAWLVPIIFSIPVAFGWNCVEHCKCLPMYRDVVTCKAEPDSGTFCSRVWPPMSRSFVITTTIFFFLALVIMAVTLISTIVKFYKTHSVKPTTHNIDVEPQLNLGETHAQSWPDQGDAEMEKDISKKNPSTKEDLRTRADIRVSTGRPPLSGAVKLIIVLTVSLFLFILPIEAIWFLDVFVTTDPTVTAFQITLAITFVYVASVPVMLLVYMSGVRQACIYILHKLPCFRPTIIIKRTRTKKKTLKSKREINANGETDETQP